VDEGQAVLFGKYDITIKNVHLRKC